MSDHEALKIALTSRVKTSAPYEPDYMMPPPQIQVAAKEAIYELEQQLTKCEKQVELYELALIAAFPEGASGEVFDLWNAARKKERSE